MLSFRVAKTPAPPEKTGTGHNRPGGRRAGRELAVVAAYGVVAVVFTWPLALHFNQAVPGQPAGDGWQMVWNLWWVRYALEQAQNPFQTSLMFYPQGTGLYLHALNALNGLLSLPVQYLGAATGGAADGAVAGYNYIVWLSLTLAAYGAFCLARYLWNDYPAALVAGLAYGFSTYNFDHLLGHLNLVSGELIPFYLLFFLKGLHNPDRRRARAYLGWAGASLAGLTLLELQYVLYLAILSLLYLLYLGAVWRWPGLRRPAPRFNLPVSYGRAAALAALFGLVTLPFTIPMLREALTNPNTVPPRQEEVYSADLLAYFYPSPFHPLWGERMMQAIKPFTATLIEKVVFPTFTVYLLILAGGLATWAGQRFRAGPPAADGESGEYRPGAGWWVLAAAVFGVLSLGPRLHLNGAVIGPPLPGALLYRLPLLNITRVPARFSIIAILALALLAAWGLHRLGPVVGSRRVYYGLAAAALAVLAVELAPMPYQMNFYRVPDFYRTLAADPRRDYAIMDVPLNYGRYQYETAYLRDQMTHHKPILNGYISRNPVFPPYHGVPVFRSFRDLSVKSKPDILPELPADPAILRYFGVRYISIRKALLSGQAQSNAFELVSKLLPGQVPVSDSPEMAVYEVPPGPKAAFFYNLVLPSWYEAEQAPGAPVSRWANGTAAGIEWWSQQARTVELEFAVWSFYEPHPVEFRLNDRPIDRAQVGPEPQVKKVRLDLQPGYNRLTLQIGGRAYQPAGLGLGQDDRWLSVAVGEIKIVEVR